jgi:hypothetical protein
MGDVCRMKKKEGKGGGGIVFWPKLPTDSTPLFACLAGRYVRWARTDEEKALSVLLGAPGKAKPSARRRMSTGTTSRSRSQSSPTSSDSHGGGGVGGEDEGGKGTGRRVTPALLSRLAIESANHWRQPLNE